MKLVIRPEKWTNIYKETDRFAPFKAKRSWANVNKKVFRWALPYGQGKATGHEMDI